MMTAADSQRRTGQAGLRGGNTRVAPSCEPLTTDCQREDNGDNEDEDDTDDDADSGGDGTEGGTVGQSAWHWTAGLGLGARCLELLSVVAVTTLAPRTSLGRL